ncbi:Rap1a/Tai family immunity protein [Sphingomonas sp.]|uniref:Rap1a/Tai family immunity protein n=1 Tax=Sphingomonas sp. TaxID=28214 RepID=UPI0025D72748|nr:Rap1a/Tai family immunity protein [Sphingomonas sp.]
MFISLIAATLLAGEAPRLPTRIGFASAGELALRCAETSPAGATYCFTYIAAVYDTVRAYEQWLHLREFCLPYNVTQSDLRRTFIDYLGTHPLDRSGQAASVVVAALKQHYPCAVAVPPPLSAPSPAPKPSLRTPR